MFLTSKLRAWLLLDERPGHQSQVLGVGRALGSQNELIPLEFNQIAMLPNALLGSHLWGVSAGTKQALVPPYPDVVIAAGRRCVPLMRHLKKAWPDLFTVQLMWPGAAHPELDLIAVPEHDGISQNEQVITTIGAAHNVTDADLAKAKDHWQARFGNFENPVGVLIGGNSKHGELFLEDAPALAAKINRYGSALITTSRRTPAGFVDALLAEVKVPIFLHMVGDGENPFYGILACADALIVTGDSASMLCEAYYTQKPVEIFAPTHLCAHKHRRLHEALVKHGSETRLDEAARIATIIHEKLAKKA